MNVNPAVDRTHRGVVRQRPRPRHLAVGLALALGLAGCGGDDAGGTGDAAAASGIEVEAGDLYFEPDALTATAGEVTVTLDNVGAIEHDFVIEEAGDVDVVGMVAPGDSATGTVELEAGTYTVYCSVAGHRSAGMEATLGVQ
jgi:plastocyanin